MKNSTAERQGLVTASNLPMSGDGNLANKSGSSNIEPLIDPTIERFSMRTYT
jgi:hypothetical protein